MVLALLHTLLSSDIAHAQSTLAIDLGVRITIQQVLLNVVNFLAASIGVIAAVLFIFGALKLTASGVNEEWRQQGKDLMLGSLYAIVAVLGAYALLRTVASFLVP